MASDRNNPWNTKTHPSPVLFLAKHCFPLLLFTPCKARVSAMHQKTMLPVISLMVHDVACGVKTRIQIRARCSLYPFFDIAPICSNKKSWLSIWPGPYMGKHLITVRDKSVQLNHKQYLKQCLQHWNYFLWQICGVVWIELGAVLHFSVYLYVSPAGSLSGW